MKLALCVHLILFVAAVATNAICARWTRKPKFHTFCTYLSGVRELAMAQSSDHSLRGQVGSFIKKELAVGEEQAMKEQIQMKHSLGLGQKPNVIPPAEASITGPPRKVELGWHPVAGMGGKWFAEQTWFGKEITHVAGKYPDPSQHWAVLAGDFIHELWMDEQFHIIYINETLKREEWHTFPVGETRFNDEALRQAAEMVIHNMQQKQPAYNLISNNCQNFAENLLDAIQIGAHQEFATAFNVYQRATGKGDIKDLFKAHTDAHPDQQSTPQVSASHENTIQYAQQLMHDHTTKLDFHAESLLKAFHHKTS